jgi:multiple sugar transport system substrate-binding protein
MKKILSLLTVLVMLFSLAPLAFAEETLKNPNIKIVFWMSSNGYLNEKAKNDAVFEASMEAKAAFEEKYGGTVEVIGVTWDQQLQKCIDMQQAGDAPDLVLMYESVFHGAVQQGIIQNIDQYVTPEDYAYYPISEENYMWGGNHYAVPIKPYLKHITFNRTLFECEGLEAPDELYAKGEWTFDKFLEAGQALTQDTDGDGEIDQWGFSGYGDTMSHFIIANHGALLNIDQANKKVTSGLKNPETLEALTYLGEMMNNASPMWMLTDSEMFGYFDNNALGMIVGKEIQDARQLPFDVGMVPYPAGPSGSTDEVYVYSQSWAVPTGAKNPEGAIAYIRMINDIQKAQGDEKERARYGQAPDGSDMYDLIYNNHTLITKYDKGLAGIFEVMATINNYLADGIPASTVAERVEPLVTAEIEKTFGK